MGRFVFVSALFIVLLIGALPVLATVTGAGSAHAPQGGAVGVNITTDGTVVAINGSHSPIKVVRSGSAPTFRFTFFPGNITPGSYGYTFIDDVGGSSSFTLIVDASAVTTTTTTTQPPRTTTTEPVTTTAEPTPTVSIADRSATEGSALAFRVTLSAESSERITVDYATANGTATTADSDYTSASGVVVFPPGDTEETVVIPTGNDASDETDEDFTVMLSSPSNATIGDGSATGTIKDNDPLITASSTTTVPTATTTSTLAPAAVAAPDEPRNRVFMSRDTLILLAWIGVGLALVAIAVWGAYAYSRRQRAYGSQAPSFLATWRNRNQERSTATSDGGSRAGRIRSWWRASGPVASYRDWKARRHTSRELNRRNEERRRRQDE